MILVSVVVGYGFAYLSASKKWAPFGKMQGQETNYSKTMDGNDSGKVVAMEVSEAEMKAMSDNYAAWITGLSEKSEKGGVQKDAGSQIVVRGGKIAANLLDKLAKGNKDVYYIFGKRPNRDPIYLLLSNFDPGVEVTLEGQDKYYIAADSATMCPCVCPESLIALPPYCNLDKLPPLPPGGVQPPPPTP